MAQFDPSRIYADSARAQEHQWLDAQELASRNLSWRGRGVRPLRGSSGRGQAGRG